MGNKTNFSVEKYSIEQFKSIITDFNKSKHTSFINTKNNAHFAYFEEYFNHLNAQTIVVEHYYIDHDYLEDYSGYYVRCFKRYRRRCTRLHFFNTIFTKEEFVHYFEICDEGVQSLLQNAYMGFIVIKPLPKTIFGRTCLKTYESDNGRRHYPTIRNYEVNLYGITLSVKSVAYQEQDRVVSACATSALWSIFHYTGVKFQHQILSPLKITNAACSDFPSDQRFVPNDGLDVNQMIHGIYSVGLEPYIAEINEIPRLKNEIYGYLKGEIPIMLGVDLVKKNERENFGENLHAVAVMGYSLSGNYEPFGTTEILLKSSSINKIYCHDDQIGPFSRMAFNGNTIKRHYDESSFDVLEEEVLDTSWIDENGNIGNIFAVPRTILAPIYHKIRIPYTVILREIIKLDISLESLRENLKIPIGERLIWDIYLSKNSSFKSELLKNSTLPREIKNRFLFLNMPRYIWRATALNNNQEKIIDIIFDATDLEQGKILHCLLIYSQDIYDAICQNLDSKKNELEENQLWSCLYDWFYQKCEIVRAPN